MTDTPDQPGAHQITYFDDGVEGTVNIRPPDPTFNAPLRQLIHNIHQFGDKWSWRCGVGYSTLDPGYIDGGCRYDHIVNSWEQLVDDATEHLASWHDTHPMEQE